MISQWSSLEKSSTKLLTSLIHFLKICVNKAGDSFKSTIFKLSSRITPDEEFPERFFEIVIHQLRKKKLPKKELSNRRLLHIKD